MDIKKVMENLNKNNIATYYAETKADVLPMLDEIMQEGETVAVGGSMSLFDCGVIDYLRSGRYNFLDRYVPGLSPEQVRDIYVKSLGADTYLCSSNAVTEDGELVNCDGNANRIAAIAYGPLSVIMVVGVNKIVKNIDEAVQRIKTQAAPKNCVRLSCDTYCAKEGHCVSQENFKGCGSESRICADWLISSRQRVKDRIKVIFVNEEIGY